MYALPTNLVHDVYQYDSSEHAVLLQLVADVADAPLGDNKPNFPTPDTNPSNNQDVFKQLGDKVSFLLLNGKVVETLFVAQQKPRRLQGRLGYLQTML